MDLSERVIQTWMASGGQGEIDQLVSDITGDRTSFVNVVKGLGEYLTSEDDEILGKGVELLALVVTSVPQDKLNRQSVKVLAAFFTGKIEDSSTVKHALGGILALSSSPNFSPDEASVVLQALFKDIRMKALAQDVRFKVFSIIDTLMAKHREVLKSSKEFLDGYISLAEEEKDPRNLMIAFAIGRVIVIEFDISTHVESMFNILFCYFPITFRPPPNDKYAITSDDLKTSLRRCLGATPAFGTLAIPVFLEKLTVGSRATKRDTLQTLSCCLPIYGFAAAQAFARKLWNSLKLEVFQPVDSQVESDALNTIQVLVKTIYEENDVASTSTDDIKGLAREASEECIQILKETEKSQARPATKILCVFMSTTPYVARYTISQVVPHFIRLFHNPDEAPTRLGTLTLLCEVIDSARSSARQDNGAALMPFKDEVLGLYIAGLQTTSLRTIALSGLKGLALTEGLLTDDEIGYVVHKVNDIIAVNQDDFDETSEAILELFNAIAERAPRHIADQTLPLLFALLPENSPAREAISDREKCWRILSTIRRLCIPQALFEVMVVRLMARFDYLCFSSRLQGEELELAQAYSYMILKTLAEALRAKVKGKNADVVKYIDSLVPRVLNAFAFSAILSEDGKIVASDPRLFKVASDIITLVVQSLPLSSQQMYSVGLSKAILDGDLTDIAQGFQDLPSSLSIFGASSKREHRELLPLLSSAVIALRKELPLDDTFLNTLLNWVLEVADSDLQRLSALHLVASIVNRRAEDLTSFLNFLLGKYWTSQILDNSLSVQRRKWAIISWIWTSKALLVRKHPLAMTFAERLYDLLEDKEVGWDAAKALGDVIDSDTILTKDNHANVKILYVQKYVSVILPKLFALARTGNKITEQTASLVALISVVKACPRSTYVTELPSLIPFILRGLELPDAGIRGNAIAILIAAAEFESLEKPMIAEHSSTLVNLMLKNSRIDDMPLVSVRISALQYLAILPGIVRYDVLHPCKSLVLRELNKALDDPKRSVRKEAVQARTTWFKYKG